MSEYVAVKIFPVQVCEPKLPPVDIELMQSDPVNINPNPVVGTE